MIYYIRKRVHVFFFCTHVVRASRYDSQILQRASYLRLCIHSHIRALLFHRV